MELFPVEAVESIKSKVRNSLPMYDKFFIATVIAFAATIAAVSGAAAAQNQTATGPADTGAPNMTLHSIKDLYLLAWNQTEFNSTFSTFVEPYSAAGYGVYEEHGDIFTPGETIVLYVEPVGFNHMPVLDDRGNTLYMMNMTADYVIAGANGTELQSIQDVPVGSIISHRPNTELFFELTLTQETPFPTGDYLLTYVVTDEVSGESFTLEKEVTVAETVSPSVV